MRERRKTYESNRAYNRCERRHRGKISETLAAKGYDLLLHYNRNEQAAECLANRLTETYGIHAEVLQSDLSEPSGAAALTDSIQQPIDAIVLNSGKSHFGLITDVDNSTVQDMVQLHIASPFILTRNLLPGMIKKKTGAIVAVSSIWGKQVLLAKCCTAWRRARKILLSKGLQRNWRLAGSA